MSDAIELNVDKREATGKQVRALRESGFVPATIYEKGKESVNVQIPFVVMNKTWKLAGKNHTIKVEIEGKKRLTIIKDVTYDPLKATLTHVAFHAINQNDPIEAEIPVHLEGDAPAVTLGNYVNRPNDHVVVKALPGDLPDVLNISAEVLKEAGDSIKASDIKMPANVTLMSDPDMTMATAEEPRIQEEPEETEVVDAANVPSDKGGDKPEETSDKASE